MATRMVDVIALVLDDLVADGTIETYQVSRANRYGAEWGAGAYFWTITLIVRRDFFVGNKPLKIGARVIQLSKGGAVSVVHDHGELTTIGWGYTEWMPELARILRAVANQLLSARTPQDGKRPKVRSAFTLTEPQSALDRLLADDILLDS